MGVTEERGPAGLVFLRNLASGVIPGLLVTLLLLFLSSVLISGELLPVSVRDELILVCAFSGAAVSGSVVAKRRAKGVIVAGLYGGAGYLLMLKLLSVCIPSGSLFHGLSLKIAICAVTGGAFGGALRSRRKKARYARGRR